ncbi:MAG TPA: branched-chain amino acid ABC transporter permease [Nitrososphaerales archaeon]|nr:branched-chain amino acid ABC transporter permease [Nitrososphaerales archaeon]
MDLLPLLVIGGVLGVIYTLLSEGFSLIYGVGGILNGAYGALYMLTDYIIFAIFIVWKVPVLAAISLSLLAIFFIALLIQKYVVARGKSQLDVLFLTLALAFVVQYGVQYLQCSSAFSGNCAYPAFVPIFVKGSSTILGVSVNNQQLAADVVAIFFLTGLWLFLSRTRYGSAIRAVSQDKDAAELTGINTERTQMLTAGIGALMAGVSSAFLGSYQSVDPTIGWSIITLAFAIVILGGLGSLKGALLASFILAFAQTFVLLFVNTLLSDFVSLSILILVLLIRPQGIFGREVVS